MSKEFAFEMAISNLRYGPGVTHEIGKDLKEIGAKNVMFVTDPRVAQLRPVQTVRESMEKHKIPYGLFDRVRVEPSDQSFCEAITFAQTGDYDVFVAVGGGSVIDTAKAANLYSTWPADFLTYVNAPVGQGKPVPGPIKPLFAIPTTAGTGSETTGVAIFDFMERHTKTGIAHRRLKPTLGIVDPENTRSLPPLVTASVGMDVLIHAVESYTAIPYTERPYPETPVERPAYQGANPISDIWAMQALRMVSKNLERAYKDPNDDEARSQMILASAYAGMGFGNAGVHLCHGMSYPVSSLVRNYQPPGYPEDHPMVPHGISVVLNAPAVFRFTASACPQRHLKVAQALGADVSKVSPKDAGKILSDCIITLMQKVNLPNGLSAIRFNRDDIPALVEGTLPQHRVTKLSPRPVGAEELTELFTHSMIIW